MYCTQLKTTKTDVSCMTDMSKMQYSADSSTYATSGHNECDSDTSGYLSASSLDSTGEERRLAANDDKIMSVWSCWSQHIDSFSGPVRNIPRLNAHLRVECLKSELTSKPEVDVFRRRADPKGICADSMLKNHWIAIMQTLWTVVWTLSAVYNVKHMLVRTGSVGHTWPSLRQKRMFE